MNFDGCLAEFRLSKGIARWTRDFIPPYPTKQEILQKASSVRHQKPTWDKGDWTLDFTVKSTGRSTVRLSEMINIPQYDRLINSVPRVKLPDVNWHHVAVTCSSGKCRVFIDGKKLYRTQLEEALDNL